MADIVNLRTARKRRQRAEKDSVAEANRIAFGKPAWLRERERIERERTAAHLDGHDRSAAKHEDDGADSSS